MVKKLLFSPILILIFFLAPAQVVAQECPSTISISADPGTSICAGTNVTFTASVQDNTSYNYQWYLNGTAAGSDHFTYSNNQLTNGAKIKVVITSADTANTCSTTSNEITMTVNAVKTPTVSVSASKSSICPGEEISFTASNTNGGTAPNYTWYIGSDTTPAQDGSSSSFTTTALTATNNNVRVVLTSSLECVSSSTASVTSTDITIKPGTPETPAAISGQQNVCPGTSQTYSISPVEGASAYEWTLPSGWTGSSTSTSITVTTGTSNGNISVKAKNSCGTSAAQNFAITVKAGTPAVPGTITGETAVCPGVSQTYSIAEVTGATEYIWTLPSGWTGSSTTTSIQVITGSSGSGNITVQAKNDCGTSEGRTLSVSVKAGTPSTPGAISGASEVCPGVSQTYTIAEVSGATSYNWSLPAGWTGSSTSRSITVTTGSTGGNIGVTASNDCGTGTETVLAITVNPGTPAKPVSISGATAVCPGVAETYTIDAVEHAEKYVWTIPSGWSAASLTTSEPSLTATPGSSGSGNITVKAENSCGTSAAESLAVSISNPAPTMSGSITGPGQVCSTATGLVYSIPAITNATGYKWTLPEGWVITGGEGTRSITVSASSYSGNFSVVATNSCGDSAASPDYMVTSTTGVPATPGAISAPNLPTSAICPPATGIEFTVPEVAGATGYKWTLPSGWEITSGSNTNTIIVKVNSTAATTSNASISVEAVNICGNSAKSTMDGIAIDKHVITDAGADQTVCRNIAPINIEGSYSFSGTNSNLKPTWSAPDGMGSFFNSTKLATTFTPTQAALDQGSVVLTLTTDAPSGACGPGIDEMTIFFKPLPSAILTVTSPVCSGNNATLTFTGTPNSRVTYKLPDGTSQTIDIPSSGTVDAVTGVLTTNSTYTLVSSVNLDSPACTYNFPASTTTTVTVTPKPTAEITYSGTPFCSSNTTAQAVTLTGTNAYTGGTFSAPEGLAIDTINGTITPSGSTPGTYTVSYSTKEEGGCAPVIATTEVTITKEPTATISYGNNPFCTSDSTPKAVTLSGTEAYTGGTFSAPAGLSINSSTGEITPGASTAGTYTVTYQTPAGGGCGQIATTTEVTITKAPTVTISYDSPFCHADSASQAVTLSGTDAYLNGSFSAPAGLSIDPATGAVTPSSSSAGTYEVTYTTPASAGCGEVSTTTSITITETPSATFSYAGPFCTSDDTAQLPVFSNTTGVYEGGTFRSTPEGLGIDPNTGAIVARNSSPNTYTVFYKIPAGGGCGASEIQTNVTITQAPQLEIAYGSPFCSSDATSYPVIFSSNSVGAYTGGSFSGTSGLSIDASGNIIPASSTPGVHTVTYTTPEADGCSSVQVTTQVEIFEKIQITTQPTNVGICSTEPASFEVVATGDGLIYQWKRADGAAITNASGVNSPRLEFTNATSVNAGEYYVEISGTSPCTPVESERVTLNVDENIIIIKPTEDMTFCDQERADVTFEFIAHANGAPLEFTWIKDGADLPSVNSDKLTFQVTGPVGTNGEYTGTLKITNPNPSDNGVYAVRINGPEYFTCSDATSKTFTLNVDPLPAPPTTEPVVWCQGDTASPLTASGETGAIFQWYDATGNLLQEAPTPPTAEAGTLSYFVTQTTDKCESDATELLVTINPTPALPTTEEQLSYCFKEENVPALSATGTDTSASINWYGPNDATLALTEAPIPGTGTVGITKYWVSQSIGDCESELVEIVVTIDPLPELSVTADQLTICEGSSTVLRASGATSYSWSLNGQILGSGAELTVSPETTTTYHVTGTDTNGCSNSSEITIEVDSATYTGTLSAPASVCISNPAGTLTLSEHVGEIVKWEYLVEGQTTWNLLNSGSVEATQPFSSLTATTTFRATIKNGVCGEEIIEKTVAVDPLPEGGILNFQDLIAEDNDGTYFMICQGATSGYLPLTLSGNVGTIVAWKYRSGTGTWLNVPGENGNFTGNILTATQIQNLALSETTVFRVEIQSGACVPNAFSETAIISVIPTDIKPSPVTVSDDVVCLGEDVTLNSETGYEDGLPTIEGGTFDNAGLKNAGWRFGLDGQDVNFETNANNTNQDFWSRATPHDFNTADYDDSPYTMTPQRWDAGVEDGNKGFALVSGDHVATMETNIFSIGSMDQAVVTFDQAYNLTPGATIKVEISKDGGITYEEVLFTITGSATSGNYGSFGTGTRTTRPKNKMVLDLGNYLGENNLRLKFTFDGARDGDLWAVDAIKLPEGPRNVTIEWNDYTNPDSPILIGNTNTVKYIPTKIGLNIFEVKTKLIFDSTGNACDIAENGQNVEVFVFDRYVTNTTAIVGSCGGLTAQLSATVTNGAGETVTSFPTPDGYVGEWKIEGIGYELLDSDPNDSILAVNDPNAILSATDFGNFKASFVLKSTFKNDAGVLYENTDCQPATPPHDIVLQACTTLDFDGVDDFVDLGETYSGDYSIEAWIRPEASTGTIISTPQLEINMSHLPEVTPNTRWYHIAVDSNGKLYIDGIDTGRAITAPGSTRALIGARWTAPNTGNYFSGWIEEVRIWEGVITQDQIRFLMNQRLQNAANIGVQIPMPAPGLPYSSLAGYYQLLATNILNGGYTADLSGSPVNGKLRNMETLQENTAPLPYTTSADGKWTDENATWTHHSVWDIPNANGVNGQPINWNIVKTSHNLTSQNKDITLLGLISETGELTIADPNVPQDETNTGKYLLLTHYLRLNGSIDLVGESQLLQPEGSIVDAASTGFLERDQQGTASSYNYNYWSSPVSPLANNGPYTVSTVMKDGTDATKDPLDLVFGDAYTFADGDYSIPRKISNYWLFKFHGTANDYGKWFHIGSTGSLKVGEGYSMKGTSGLAAIEDPQNYTFKGLPNNGPISLTIGQQQNYLVGNPYPSAIDANVFILDNMSSAVSGGLNTNNIFNGTLYFWSHFAGQTHHLQEYIGGYATYNLSGGTVAYATDERINNTGAAGGDEPDRFIPVGQGFFVNTAPIPGSTLTISGGEIHFKNSQRTYHREIDGQSVFHKPEDRTKGQTTSKDDRMKIWVKFQSPKGYHRQLLVTADPNASNGFDLGYDAPMIENNAEDMYWYFNDYEFVIQGVAHFNEDQKLSLGFKAKEEGAIKISIDKLKNIPEDMPVYLRDSVLEVYHDLREGSYESSVEGGTVNDRFSIVFSLPQPEIEEPPLDDEEIVSGDFEIVYANGTREVLLKNPRLVEISRIYLHNMLGQQVMVYYDIPEQAELRLPVNRFSAGVYIVKVHTAEGIKTKKIILD